MPFLDHEGNTREIVAGETLVGSGSQAAWRLPSADLAARHFTITVAGDGATLKPYSAQNVVVVNGRQVPLAGVALSDGDSIAAGSAQFFYVEDVNRPRAAAVSSGGTAYMVDDQDRVAYPLTKKTVNIGRDAASQIPLRDPSVSRFHADVRTEAGQHVLYAMGSSGTRVNGHGLSAPRLLEEGDQVEIGGTTLRFTREAPASGITVKQGSDADLEDRAARRPTMMATDAVTVEESAYGSKPRRSVMPLVAAVVAIIALLAWWVSR